MSSNPYVQNAVLATDGRHHLVAEIIFQSMHDNTRSFRDTADGDSFSDSGSTPGNNDDFVRKPVQEAVIFEKMAQHLGISYIYEQSPHALFQQQATAQFILTPETFATMPAEWRTQLYEAATQVS